MKYKIFLSDFDGTLVDKDILDVICGINGKYEESLKLNEPVANGTNTEGLLPLKKRIDLLKGITDEQIKTELDKNNYLIYGAKELFNYLKDNGIITVLHSGNITPVLKYYQQLLNIDYIVGNEPRYEDNKISGIELSDFKGQSFKVDGCKEIIEKINIEKSQVIAIGDSIVDSAIFEISALKIAINPKGGIEKKANCVVNDLKEVIEIIKNN